MTNNSEYWKRRAEEIASKQFDKIDNYIVRMNLEYLEALQSLQKDIEIFYQRFAQNNEISLAEARKLLNSNELQEFKMGLEEFTRKAKGNKNEQWEKELNNASFKVRITRLQALQMQIKNAIEELYYKQEEDVKEILSDIYQDSYYRNIYETQIATGIGASFAKIDELALTKVLNEKWHEGNYSSRIWENKGKLLLELQTNLAQAFIRGDSIDKTSKIIANRLNVARNRARTLVNTESAYIASKATFDGYSNSGIVEQYQILATLDLSTSEICRSLDGKIFNLNEKEIGVTAPPFHPNCRTTTVAYFEGMMFGERKARGSDGKTYYVDRNMTYQEWYDKYVKSDPVELAAEKKIKNKANDKKQFEEYKKVLGNEAPRKFEDFQELKYNNVNEWNTLKDNYARTNRFNKIVKESSELHIKGEVIKDIGRIDINDFEFDEVHINLDRKHNTSKKMAQDYINNAEVAYRRWKGEVIVYVSKDGCSVVNLKDKKVSTAYRSEEYDDKFKKIIEVIKGD